MSDDCSPALREGQFRLFQKGFDDTPIGGRARDPWEFVALDSLPPERKFSLEEWKEWSHLVLKFLERCGSNGWKMPPGYEAAESDNDSPVPQDSPLVCMLNKLEVDRMIVRDFGDRRIYITQSGLNFVQSAAEN